MSLTHSLIFTWQGQNGNSIAKTVTSTSGAEQSIDETIPALASDLEVALVLDVSQVKSIYIVASAAMTLETNSGSAADNTVTLVANIPFVWHYQDGTTLRDTAGVAITTDITALFVTSTAGGTLQVRVLVDPTA
jgi:hypothetical protein